MKYPAPALLLTLLPAAAAATTLPLPQGARWLVGAADAGQFARETTVLLQHAGGQTPIMSVGRVAAQIEGRCGLPLIDAEALAAAGVDVGQSWIAFDRGDAIYLAVTVKDPAALGAHLDQWASRRQLRTRVEEKVAGFRAPAVTFSRSEGTRPVAGYLISKGRAVILVKPAERTAELGKAFAAIDNAAPVSVPVAGTVLVWLGREVPFKDAWLGYSFRADGIDLAGSGRKSDPGWIVRDPHRADWLRALTGPIGGAQGSEPPPPAWWRATAGPKGTVSIMQSVAGWIGRTDDKVLSWLVGLQSLSGGPVEVMARRLDVAPVQVASTGDFSSDLLAMTQPQVLLEDRATTAITASLDSASAALCDGQRDGDVVRSRCPGTHVLVRSLRTSLGVAWGTEGGPPELPLAVDATPALSCAKGTPVGSVRIDPSAVFRGTRNIGLFDAFSSGTLAGLYGLAIEFGPLLKASQPAIALACQEANGRITLQGRWRFAEPQR
jgi:hypothetical protein